MNQRVGNRSWCRLVSLQYRPAPAFTINFAPLVGIGPDAGDAQMFLNLGYEF